MPRRAEPEPERVYSISSLPRSGREDRDSRLRNYLISMTIRTVCFAMTGVFLTLIPWTPGAWLCALAAVVLPYPAVVFANAQDKRTSTVDAETVTHRMLLPGPTRHAHGH